MAPNLKFMLISGSQNQQTSSIIEHITKSRQNAQDFSDRNGNVDVKENEFDKAVYEHSAGKGKLLSAYQDKAFNPNKTKDKEPITDAQLETVSIWIQQNGNETQLEGEMERQREMEINARFRQYKHHHFFEQWSILGSSEGKDEEWWIKDPPIITEDDPDYMCEMCRHISFNTLFNDRNLPGNDLPGPTKIRLHGLERIIRRNNCSFCRLITSRIIADKIISLDDHECLKFADISLNVIDEGPEFALRLEIELEEVLHRWPTQRYIIQKFHEDDQPLSASAVEKTEAQMAMLKSWLSLCEEQHPQDKRRHVEQSVSKLRLIDVEENRLFEAELPCRYVCLSYVWGGINQPQNFAKLRRSLGEIGGLKLVELPQTISDAMEVTRRLNIRYLWVDALCIEQDNEEDKRMKIRDMGSIYANAALTLVAATNSTPLDGLPGVTSIPRSRNQLRGKVQGVHMAVAFNDPRLPLPDIESSVWNTRAWTYQERQLSRRMVFFTDSNLVFACPHATYFEDTVPTQISGFKSKPIDDFTGAFANPQELWHKIWADPEQAHYVNKAFKTDDGIVTMIGEDLDMSKVGEVTAPVYEHKITPPSDVNGMLQIAGQNFWDIYRQAASSYTGRQLTDCRDAVAAFEGMADLIRGGANIKFWYNLPDCAFEQALLWYPQTPLERRQRENKLLFPSWSWAGWEGHVSYRGRGWYNGLYRSPASAIKWLRRLPGQEWLMKHGQNIFKNGSATIKFEELAAKAFSGELLCLEGVNPYEWYRFDDYESSGWTSCMDFERNQHAYKNDRYPEMLFNSPIPLPEQESVILPDEDGILYFQAYSVPVRFCDMEIASHVKKAAVDPFIQIGLKDEARSTNYRPTWKRILYHQGYRAGFLTLNIPFDELDLENFEQYNLIALSRDEVPRIPPPRETIEIYQRLGPMEIQWNVGFKEQGNPELLQASIAPANEVVEPDIRPKSENGDANWDQNRFKDCIYPLYNVLLVRHDGDNSHVVRIGVGKMHYHAFHHARPVFDPVRLR